MGGWDWWTYSRQPAYFLEAVLRAIRAEARRAREQQ
jgi:hypothetical protein